MYDIDPLAKAGGNERYRDDFFNLVFSPNHKGAKLPSLGARRL
ncbi:hypothetical protein [Salinimicrobium marinum]|nr:hypothetical protein [Salinimicrobium marinum]